MKKEYIVPCIKVFKIQATNMLLSSPPHEVFFPWSGNRGGSAGPDELDENSTNDSF